LAPASTKDAARLAHTSYSYDQIVVVRRELPPAGGEEGEQAQLRDRVAQPHALRSPLVVPGHGQAGVEGAQERDVGMAKGRP
jgi:hypothetical protein